ncbi:MAG: HINT domain-containing protein [Lactobacillus sp.]|nr:HINT domain-containing protein [Lactobacillus sp.]
MNPKFCFVAGTMVLTSLGLKAIEDIQVGEQVLSYNEELGIFTNKDVVEKYVNETKELVHIHTAKEEIVCTPKHSILTDKGWKEAKDITEADSIQSTADLVQVQSVETEQLPKSIKVYNLNVIGYHTYVIGDQQIIVHNACPPDDLYRGGNDMTLSPKDYKIKKGLVVPGQEGVSVNMDISKSARFGQPHKVAGIPDGLTIAQKGKDLGHFVIRPEYAMTLEQYQGLLYKVVLIPIG